MAFKFFDNSEKKVKAHAQLSLMANCVKIHCWIEKKMFFYAPIYIYFIVRYLNSSLRLTENKSLCMLERMGSSLPGYNFVTVEPKLRIILYDPIRIVRRSPNHIYHPVTPWFIRGKSIPTRLTHLSSWQTSHPKSVFNYQNSRGSLPKEGFCPKIWRV